MKKSIRTWVSLFLCIASLESLAHAHSIPVIFERDPSVPLLHLAVVVRTGAVSDPKGKSGISDFLGNALLRGTGARKKDLFDLALDQIGAKIEVETRAESLIFRGAVLSRNAADFLNLLHEALASPAFSESEINKLRKELLAELHDQLSDDRKLAREKFESFLFGDHPYGNPVHGTMKDVERIKVSDLKTHYDQMIRASRLVVIGTGDLDPQQISAFANRLAKSRAGGVPIPSLALPTLLTQREMLLVEKPDRPQVQVSIGTVGIKMQDRNYYALNIANHAFGGGSFQARLMKELREKRGWTYGAYSSFRFGTQPRSWTLMFSSANKDGVAALELALDMIKDLGAQGVTTEEFEFAKRSIINNAAFNFDTPKKRLENAILEQSLGLAPGFFKLLAAETERVSYAEVQAAVKDYFDSSRLKIGILGSTSALKEPLTQAARISNPKLVHQASYLSSQK